MLGTSSTPGCSPPARSCSPSSAPRGSAARLQDRGRPHRLHRTTVTTAMTEQRLRRTLLYVPGNMPSMLQNMSVFGSDAIIIDLEDAVPHTEKDAARRLVRRFLEGWPRTRQGDPRPHQRARHGLGLRRPPRGPPRPLRTAFASKADTPEVVERLDTLLTEFEEELGVEIGRFRILPSIESALGVINAIEIAQCSTRLPASPRRGGLHREHGDRADEDRRGAMNARARVVWAAKAAGIPAIDSIFADVTDMDGLRRETELVKGLGYTGVAREPAPDRGGARGVRAWRRRSRTRCRSSRRSSARGRWAPA